MIASRHVLRRTNAPEERATGVIVPLIQAVKQVAASGWRAFGLRPLFVLATVLACVGPAAAQGTFVMPSELENTWGSAGSSFPFLPGGISPYRFQQFYGPYDVSMPAGPHYLTGVRFRLPTGAPASLDVVVPDIQIRLATVTVAELSALFYEPNLAYDTTVVFPRGPLHLTGTRSGDFDVEIPFAVPFPYDRAASRTLVMDVINFQGSSEVTGFQVSGSETDSVFSLHGGNLVNPGYAGSDGLVTMFAYEPIPEPRTLILSMIAVSAILAERIGANRRR